MKSFLIFLFYILFFNQILLSQEKKKEIVEDDSEPSVAEDLFRKKEFDMGFRMGFGQRPEDRFESDLKNYKTDSIPTVISYTNVSSFRNSTNQEFFARLEVFRRSKIGFVFGSSYFQKFHLYEVTNSNYFTKLDFKLKTDFFFLTYHYTFPFRNFFVETGLGMGLNTITWQTNGGVYSTYGFNAQEGFMVGNGLGYRLDTSINRKISNNWILQLGLFYNYYTVPYFSGSFNDSFGSYYIRSNGSIAPLSNAEFADSLVQTDYASRKLDMRVGNVILHLGVVFRFSL